MSIRALGWRQGRGGQPVCRARPGGLVRRWYVDSICRMSPTSIKREAAWCRFGAGSYYFEEGGRMSLGGTLNALASFHIVRKVIDRPASIRW
jgi:hypothetical protein